MSRAKDYIPSTDADFNQFFKNITQYVNAKCAGSSPEWTHIPKEERERLDQAYIDWYSAYALTFKPHSKDITKQKNRARKEAEGILREFVNRFMRYPPVTDQDRDIMGINNHDITRTPRFGVSELAGTEVKLRNIRELMLHFWIKGQRGKRAKPDGYKGAVIAWDVRDTPPDRPEDLTRRALATRTPYVLQFDETERGKTVYFAAAWQNDRGQVGQWSEIGKAFVP